MCRLFPATKKLTRLNIRSPINPYGICGVWRVWLSFPFPFLFLYSSGTGNIYLSGWLVGYLCTLMYREEGRGCGCG